MACFVYEAMILFGVGLIPGAIGALLTAAGVTHNPYGESALRLIGFVVFGAYFTWFWSVRGQTLPMQTWGIRVVTVKGGPLRPPIAFARYLACCAWIAPAAVLAHFNGWVGWSALAAVGAWIGVYALLALLHPQHQFWHDTLCGTQLVSAPIGSRTKTV